LKEKIFIVNRREFIQKVFYIFDVNISING